MGVILAITGRNLRIFVRDPLSVFFSLLSALIVFLLYALFLGNLQVSNISESLPGTDPDQVRAFVDAWMFGGIVALSTMTTPLSAMSVFVEDSASGRFRDFLVSPIRRGQLVAGYLLSAFLIGIVITLIVLAVALLYLWALSGVVLGWAEIARTLGWIVLSTAGFAGLWALVVSFLRTTGAFAAVSTITGTIVGFIAGAYIAVGLFPDTVRNVASALPFAQSAMLFRQEFTDETLSELTGGNAAAIEALDAFYGITLSVGDWVVPIWFAAAVLAVMAIVLAAIAAGRIRSRIQ